MFTANEDGKGHKNITEPSVTFTVTQSKSSSPPPSAEWNKSCSDFIPVYGNGNGTASEL